MVPHPMTLPIHLIQIEHNKLCTLYKMYKYWQRHAAALGPSPFLATLSHTVSLMCKSSEAGVNVKVQTLIGWTSSKQEELRYIMRQHPFPGSLTDWVSPFCTVCYFIHPPTSFIYFFWGVMLAVALFKQETSLSGLAATSDTLLSASCPGISCSYKYDKNLIAAQIAVSGSNGREWSFEWAHMVSKAPHFGVSPLFVCFESSVSATVWFWDGKHLAVPIKMPKWPQ